MNRLFRQIKSKNRIFKLKQYFSLNHKRMKLFQKINLLILLIVIPFMSDGQKLLNNEYWPVITQEAKPWTRWWWLGSAVDHENISRLMNDYADKGIGGVEITPIYGVKGEEDNYIDFLSAEWINMLKITVESAQKNQMGVDMNTGTGWPFGGPTITSEFAAKKMQFHTFENTSQEELEQFVSEMEKNQEEDLIALSAYNSNYRINLLEEENSLEDIDDKSLQIIAITQINTGQKVKRAAPGGEGLIFNHFSEEATNHYLNRFDDSFNGNPGVRCFFNDSYELNWANATSYLFETFKTIKGYDLALYAKELTGEGKIDDIARIKSDYRDVLNELLMENFTLTWKKWAAKYGAKTRNQAHGSPGNLIDLYAAVGIPEMETFQTTNFPFLQDFIDQSDAKHTESNRLFKKFASSAAHQKNENLVSCETFTWLNEHFKTPLYQCKAELDELFVKGVTHLFFHGTTYSPERALWPGWLFYAAIHVEPNNPQWEHIKAMNEYISRCQSILQLGKHTNDFLVFWSPDDFNHDADTLEKKLTLHNSEEWIHMPEADVLLDKGYQFDFTTDRIITKEMEVENGKLFTYGQSEYKTIVFPHLNRIKLTTFKKLLQLAEDGATLVFSNIPDKVSGFKNYNDQEKELTELIASLNFSREGQLQTVEKGKGRIYLGNVEAALKDLGIARESLIDHHIKNISRKTENGVYYFIANHEKEKMDEWLSFKHGAKNALLMNPMNGNVLLAECELDKVHIELESGASAIVYFTNDEVDGLKKYAYSKKGKSIPLTGQWKLKSITGGPQLIEETILPKLEFWTNLPGLKNKHFAGTCEYSTSFNIENTETDRYLLRLEKVEASAKVFVNDEEVATLWSFPFEVEVGDFINEGDNTLRIEVSNLGANRIRYMDQQGIEWKKFHDINIVNLEYKPLNASDWEVLPSGLSGKVELVPLVN